MRNKIFSIFVVMSFFSQFMITAVFAKPEKIEAIKESMSFVKGWLTSKEMRSAVGGTGCSNVGAGGGAGLGTKSKDPIDLTNGNMTYSIQDVVYPSIGLPFDLTRTYNAQTFTDFQNWMPDEGTGSWTIEKGQLSGQGDRLLTKNVFPSDVEIELDMKTIDAGDEGWSSSWVNFRFQDEDNRYYFAIHQNGTLEVSKKVGGVFTQLYQNTNANFNPFDWNNVIIKTEVNAIQVWVNNSLVINIQDTPSITSGQVVLEAFFVHSHFDNISVWAQNRLANDPLSFVDNFNENLNDLPFGSNWQFSYGFDYGKKLMEMLLLNTKMDDEMFLLLTDQGMTHLFKYLIR